MSGATSSVWLWLILVFTIFIPSSSAELINITGVSGDNATFSCRVLDGNKTINGLEWSKPELETEYVFLYRDSKPDLTKQHPPYKNRVDLQDRKMKDGDVSVILKDVTTADAGTYECRVFTGGTNRRKRAYLGGDPICIVNLRVVDPPGNGGKEDGSYALAAGLSATAVVVVASITGGPLIYRRCRKQKGPSQSLDSLDTGLLS